MKDIPLSVADSVIVHELEAMKCKISGKVARQKLRVNGELTNCLNGDRVLYIEPRPKPLERHVRIASFRARIFHDGQTIVSQATCSRCLATGHHASTCTKPCVCRTCNKPGHKSYECPSSRDQSARNSGATDRVKHGEGNNSESRQTQGNPHSTTGATQGAGVSEKPEASDKAGKQPDRESRRNTDDSRKQQNLKDIWSRRERTHNTEAESDSTEGADRSEEESEYDDTNAFESVQEDIRQDERKKKRKRRKKGSYKK